MFYFLFIPTESYLFYVYKKYLHTEIFTATDIFIYLYRYMRVILTQIHTYLDTTQIA